MGYRRAIKPDVLAPGGRVVVRRAWSSGGQPDALEIYMRLGAPGQLVASPGVNPGEQDAVWYSRGTSNATAIVSRACGWLYDLTEELRVEPSGDIVDSIPRAVWLKALVAHGSEWGTAGTTLTNMLKNRNNSRQFREYITRLLGYGAMNIDRCTRMHGAARNGAQRRRATSGRIAHSPFSLAAVIKRFAWTPAVDNHPRLAVANQSTAPGLAEGGSVVHPRECASTG